MGTTEETGAVEQRWQQPISMLGDFAGEDRDPEVLDLSQRFLKLHSVCMASNPESPSRIEGAYQEYGSRACRQLSQMTVAARWIAPRKFLAVLS